MTYKKKQGDFNFALELRESDFSRYRVRILPTLPGLVSPVRSLLIVILQSFMVATMTG